MEGEWLHIYLFCLFLPKFAFANFFKSSFQNDSRSIFHKFVKKERKQQRQIQTKWKKGEKVEQHEERWRKNHRFIHTISSAMKWILLSVAFYEFERGRLLAKIRKNDLYPIRVPHGPEENHGNTYQPWYDRNLSKKSYCCSEGCLKWNGSIWKVLFTNMFWDSSSYPLYVISFNEFVLYFLEDVNVFCSHITKRIKP